MFLLDIISKIFKFCFGTRFGCLKKHQLFIIVSTAVHWVKPAQPVEPICTDEGPADEAGGIVFQNLQKYL